MERFLVESMKKWKSSPNRKPLILRGARQVGKTWLMKEFGRTSFSKTAYINFENNERMKTVFQDDFDIQRIITALQIETGIQINANDTLIIFDEIQEVPKALTSLKYFFENAPQYCIVAAGSLLGIALHEGTSFPVGKVDFLDVYPLNFREFLVACGEKDLCDCLMTEDIKLMTAFKSRYIDLLKKYYFVGGMPEAVNEFITSSDFTKVRQIQNNLLLYYQQDFSKHAPVREVPRLNMIWQSVPSQLAKENKKFVYTALRKGARAAEFEVAIQWLNDCSLVHKVSRVNKGDIPLIAYMDLNAFKLYLNDVGLLCAMGGINSKVILEGSSIFEEFKGALTEQYVLQQLISDCGIKPYYFSSENSTAEIDFIIQKEDKIIPIEVKAAENLKAKSLKIYHEKNQNPISIRTSLSDYRKDDWLTNIPLYAVCKIVSM